MAIRTLRVMPLLEPLAGLAKHIGVGLFLRDLVASRGLLFDAARVPASNMFELAEHLSDIKMLGADRPLSRESRLPSDSCCRMVRQNLGRMNERLTVPVGRRAARAILIDDLDRLVLIKRTKTGHAPYWTAPGGGVEETDASLEEALHRELSEELGAQATNVSQVFLSSSPSETGITVQYFFVARLLSLNEAARNGPEFDDPSRGGYDIDRIDLRGNDLASIDLKPTSLKEFILANRDALIFEVRADV